MARCTTDDAVEISFSGDEKSYITFFKRGKRVEIKAATFWENGILLNKDQLQKLTDKLNQWLSESQ